MLPRENSPPLHCQHAFLTHATLPDSVLTASSVLSLAQHPALRRTKKDLYRCILPGERPKGSDGNRVSRPLMFLSKKDLFRTSWGVGCQMRALRKTAYIWGCGRSTSSGVYCPESSRASQHFRKVRNPFKVEALLLCIPQINHLPSGLRDF